MKDVHTHWKHTSAAMKHQYLWYYEGFLHVNVIDWLLLIFCHCATSLWDSHFDSVTLQMEVSCDADFIVCYVLFLTGCVHVSMRTLASMEHRCMSIVLVNESCYGQLGKWSRCLIFSFSSPQWIGWLWDITPKLALWSDSFFLSLAQCQVWIKIPSHIHPHAWIPDLFDLWQEVWFIVEPPHAHSYYPTNLGVYSVCSTSSPKGPWLRYPCHVTPKDSQRSGSGGTEGPQMELHRLALLCPSPVTSPRT